MIAYHGTIVGGIKKLMPYANPQAKLKYPCVYLSTNKVFSSIFIWNKKYYFMPFEFRENGMFTYQELFDNCLSEFYSGVSGYIYTCDAEFETDENTEFPNVVISKIPVDIRDIDIVDDAYERILQYERAGLMSISRYKNRSNEQKQSDKNIILGTIKKFELLKGEHPLSELISTKFPELWEESLRSN